MMKIHIFHEGSGSGMVEGSGFSEHEWEFDRNG